ncbi:MAG: hypothetical protein OEM01_12630 [Desulfobulbaceae bacterium]|nr:hypothetical protein [Desulfobulbaceae bacterium]
MSKDVLNALQSHKVTKDFWAFYNEANSESVLTQKEELLVRIAASVSGGCVP